MIQSLKENQVFVFGSNLAGQHLGGAALQAYQSFGAEIGVGEGPTGQCYAFPTLDENLHQRLPEDLIEARDNFYEYIRNNPDKEFLLTAVGTGIAGYPLKQMKELFKNAPENVIKPIEFN